MRQILKRQGGESIVSGSEVINDTTIKIRGLTGKVRVLDLIEDQYLMEYI